MEKRSADLNLFLKPDKLEEEKGKREEEREQKVDPTPDMKEQQGQQEKENQEIEKKASAEEKQYEGELQSDISLEEKQSQESKQEMKDEMQQESAQSQSEQRESPLEVARSLEVEVKGRKRKDREAQRSQNCVSPEPFKKPKANRTWTVEEVNALENAVQLYGFQWSRIKTSKKFSAALARKDPEQLRQKWRQLSKDIPNVPDL